MSVNLNTNVIVRVCVPDSSSDIVMFRNKKTLDLISSMTEIVASVKSFGEN